MQAIIVEKSESPADKCVANKSAANKRIKNKEYKNRITSRENYEKNPHRSPLSSSHRF
jgi:hypothetical protein